MEVADLLKSKGETVITIGPQETISSALARLMEHQIGALMVCDDVKIYGIISERDILQAVYTDPGSLERKKVKDIMTTNLIVVIPNDDINYVMGIMTQNRIRHLPVITKEGIVGLISIGDIVKYKLDEAEVVNRYLEDYIYG